jgi:hypothetical protein
MLQEGEMTLIKASISYGSGLQTEGFFKVLSGSPEQHI